jgi:hypothetical protein
MAKNFACSFPSESAIISLSRMMLIATLILFASLVNSITEEQLIRDMQEFNAWAEKNKNNTKFKAKKFSPPVESLESTEHFGGIEALTFLKMYRRNELGDIPDKITLFKEFFEHYEEIEKSVFYRLSAVWLKRQHYELLTG